ncbi:hypothetical protein SOVF_013150 [Spinacia oleracea]|nr:hypothetical protein SOVF_013150 [Spinacia oleracea]
MLNPASYPVISDAHHWRPSSASDPKLMMHNKLASNVLHMEGNDQKTMFSPASHTGGEDRNHSSLIEETNRKKNKPGKAHERKARAKRPKRTSFKNEPSDAALLGLRVHMESLVKEMKTTRESLISWMDSKLKSDDFDFFKPSGTRNGQEQNMKRSKPLRNSPNKGKRTSSAITDDCEEGDLGRRFPSTNGELVIPPKEEEENKEKRKGIIISGFSTKKQKLVGNEADQWTNYTAGGADDYLTLPTVLPRKQSENSDRNPLKDGNEIDFAFNSGVNLISNQLKFNPRALQNDAVIAQNNLQNLTDYQLNTGSCSSSTMGNGNGNVFSFAVPHLGSNHGIGMRNMSSQFGVQYLTQSTMISRMYRELPPGFSSSNGNNSYMGSYSALNQHLNFNAQQGGVVMAVQRQDVTKGTFNQKIS